MLNKRNYTKYLPVRLKPVQQMIIDCILDHAYNDKCYAFPSQDRIAELVNVSRQTVNRHMKKIEQLTLGGKSFMIRSKQRDPEGRFDYTVYLFPWINKTEEYMISINEETLDKLMAEYAGIAMLELEEIAKPDNHVTKKDDKPLEGSCLYLSLVNKLQRIKGYTQTKAQDFLRVLLRVGEVQKLGNPIYNLEKYLLACFKGILKENETIESINEIYEILLGNNRLHELDLDSYINDVLQLA